MKYLRRRPRTLDLMDLDIGWADLETVGFLPPKGDTSSSKRFYDCCFTKRELFVVMVSRYETVLVMMIPLRICTRRIVPFSRLKFI